MSETAAGKTGKIWLISIICGIVAFLALLFLAGYGTAASLLVGVLVAVLVAILLWIGWYEEDSAAPVSRSAGPAAAQAADNAASDAAIDATSGAAAPAAGLMTTPGTATTSGSADTPATAVPAEASPKEPAPQPETAEAKKPAATAKRAPVAKDGTPDNLLDAARESGADDLKQIKGVGPKLESTLNEIGIYHFDQLAELRKKEREWLDDRLKFKGRIDRDDWVGQAKKLAKGQDTEFSSRVKKGDVY